MRSLVEQTLKELGKYSVDSVNLILGTIAQESAYAKYRRQIGSGPALGICQMEPATFNDIVNNFLKFNRELKEKIREVSGIDDFKAADLQFNDKLSICMARAHYLRVTETIPTTIEGYATYWKKYYNTAKGKGTEAEFIRNYHLYVLNDKD